MTPVRRLDGRAIDTFTMQDGRVYVDPVRGEGHRGGPETPRHFHRFEDYDLADEWLRCRKCGLLRKFEKVDSIVA